MHDGPRTIPPVILFIWWARCRGVAPQSSVRCSVPTGRIAAEKLPYECGFEAFEDARMKFDVRYYLVAILFILFDLEIAFPCFPGRCRCGGNRCVGLLGHDVSLARPGRFSRVEEGPWTGNELNQHNGLASAWVGRKGGPRGDGIEGVLKEGFVTTSVWLELVQDGSMWR